MRSPTTFASTLVLVLGMASMPARADLMFNLHTGNAAISGFTGPYAAVDVHLVDSTHATVEFTSLTNSGNIYLMGDGGTVGVNVNATSWIISFLKDTNGGTGFATSLADLSDDGAKNEDGFGSFNQTVKSFDGFMHSSDDIQIGLENTGGTWADATSVLIGNSQGHLAAAHIFVTSSPANAANGALVTGFASASPGPTDVPEPASLALLGTALAGIGFIRRQSRR